MTCVVSVKSRNLVPVMVLKHCMRKFSVSSTSRPESASGLMVSVPEPGGFAGGTGLTGLRRAAMAWMLTIGRGW